MDETSNAPAVVNQDSLWLVLPADEIKRRGKAFGEYLGAIKNFVRSTLTEGPDADFGVIPGTKKPTLLQPGADKLMGLFGLTVRYEVEQREGPEPGRFDALVVARLYRGEQCMGEATARASSYESKWRYRFGSRKCPSCNAEAIRKSKEEWGGGWYCNKRDGGCGAKFNADDERIIAQEVGKIQNVDIADVFNTVLMVAQKRAKVAVVRTALRLTDMFTQDVGDPENVGGEDKADSTADPTGPGAALGLDTVMSLLEGKKITKAAAQVAAHALKLPTDLGKLTEAQLEKVIEKAKEK